MTNKEWEELIKFSKKLKIEFYVDVFGLKGIQEISKLKVDGIKNSFNGR